MTPGPMGGAGRCARAATGTPPIRPPRVKSRRLSSSPNLLYRRGIAVRVVWERANIDAALGPVVSSQYERRFTYRDASIYLVVSAGRGSRSVSHAAGAIVSAPLALRLPGDAIGRPSINVRSPGSCARNCPAPPRCCDIAGHFGFSHIGATNSRIFPLIRSPRFPAGGFAPPT